MGLSETHSDLLGILFIRGDLTIYALLVFFVRIKLPLQAQCSRQRRPEVLGLGMQRFSRTSIHVPGGVSCGTCVL